MPPVGYRARIAPNNPSLWLWVPAFRGDDAAWCGRGLSRHHNEGDTERFLFALIAGSLMSTAVSPLAPTDVPAMPAIAGVRLATAAAGIRYQGRTDVLLAILDKGTTVAGVFTKSKCPSAPVEWCRAKLKSGKARALVVNSGNANAFTGKSGREAVSFTARLAAQAADCKPSEVFLASTGVIGEPLKASAFEGVMEGLAQGAAPGRFLDAAKAIMTTDTFPKVATAQAKLGDATVTINGIA